MLRSALRHTHLDGCVSHRDCRAALPDRGDSLRHGNLLSAYRGLADGWRKISRRDRIVPVRKRSAAVPDEGDPEGSGKAPAGEDMSTQAQDIKTAIVLAKNL